MLPQEDGSLKQVVNWSEDASIAMVVALRDQTKRKEMA